jgi:hypothetical protein
MRKTVPVAVGTLLLILSSSASLAQEPLIQNLAKAAGNLAALLAQARLHCTATGGSLLHSMNQELCKCPEGMKYAEGQGCYKPGVGSKSPAQDPKSVRMK